MERVDVVLELSVVVYGVIDHDQQVSDHCILLGASFDDLVYLVFQAVGGLGGSQPEQVSK